ncbi:PIR protein [Plasmodium ovale]|uniref:PIR Superfamily Protein n=2 Tax=Plasmodium ovale TaxID=36330 RepID=A0A1A8XCA0_PLAOA|nr:PIR Superfamily Protein [Plasmodium ovale curtisi]SBT02324.1 PIR Superfamily Protein [Plasmodium ovale curtisi]SBT84476.1 PIR protein [Plasmodium ovale]
MGESIYSFVWFFPEHKELFDEKTKDDDLHENIFCHEISKHFINDHEKYRNPCTQVLKYLSYLESKPSLDYRACCKYLNYWLYDNVINNKKSEYNALKLYQQFKNLDNDLLDHNICEKYIEDINDDIFSELKELYTLFDKFNHIKKETTSNIANICKIADECSTLYRKQEQKCAANYKNIFCNELENFRKVYNSYMASKIKCNAESIILPSFLKNNLAAIIIVPFVIILIVSFILFILYKFTQYGSWLYPLTRRKKVMWDDMIEQTQQFQHTVEEIDNDLKHRQYNISYNTK